MTTTTKRFRSGKLDMDSPYLNKAVLDKISEIASHKLEDLMDKIGVEFRTNDKYIYGACPVHNGDNTTAFNLFFSGNTSKSNWACYTKNCHRPVNQGGFGNTVFGLVRGILSQQQNRKVSWTEAVDYVCSFLGVNIHNVEVDKIETLRNIDYTQAQVLNKKNEVLEARYKKEDVRKLLKYPAQYYLNRGYTQEILDRYDVGFCDNKEKLFYNRCVFPVYDENYQHIIGFSARSVHDRCPKCKLYHESKVNCPKNKAEEKSCGKWLHSNGFYAHKYFYNYWFSKPLIEKSHYAILVEGPGDCLKLEQLGITNSLALFGSFLSEEQLFLLETCNAMTLVVMTDNDDAGRQAAKQIKQACGRLYRLYFPKFSGKDAGELNKSVVTSDIEPILNDIKEIK